MLNTVLIVIWVLIFPLISLTATAELIDRGGGLIYDTDLDVTWLQDANYANTSDYNGADHVNGQMQWEDAKAWAGSLVYQGYNDWRLPDMKINDISCTGDDCLQTEALHLFNYEGISFSTPGPFKNLKDIYWSQTEDTINPDLAKSYTSNDGYESTIKTHYLYAMAVRDGDSTPLPGGGSEESTDNFIGCFIGSVIPGF